MAGNLDNGRNSWGEVITDIDPGGGGSKDVETFFKSGVAGCVDVLVGEVGTYL